MSLKELAESISCENIKFLDNKYDVYNNFIFKNNMKCKNENPHISNNKEKMAYLNSYSINKKSCFDFDYFNNNYNYDNDNNLILDENPYSNNIIIPISFNESTRFKLRSTI